MSQLNRRISNLLWRLLFISMAGSGLVLRAAEPLEVVTEVKKIVSDQDGHEAYVEAARANPSEVLIYLATYTNRSAAPLQEIVALMPIPPGLAYLDGSASPGAAEATQDGKRFFSLRPGTAGTPPITAWRALRWAPRSLAPGEKFVVSLRAKVLAAESPSPKSP